nr:MAG: cytochrome c oxidase assembly protein [Pseudomonadota bacterium]
MAIAAASRSTGTLMSVRLFCLPPLLGYAAVAAAHDVEEAAAAGGWQSDPWVAWPLAVSAALYVLGLARLWGSAGPGKGLGVGQALGFGAGWTVLAVALLSPLETLGAHSFAAHMVQHELVMIVAAPLLVMSRPLAAWAWAFPHRLRRAFGRCIRYRLAAACWKALRVPAGAWVLHAAVLWAWHAPALFDAALRDNGIHILQHLSFLFAALLFWWSVLGRDARIAPGVPVLSLLTTLIHTGILGALMSFAPTVWYPAYAERTPGIGLDPVADQQLGGLLMWVPAGSVYLLAALWLAWRWLAADGTAFGSAASVEDQSAATPSKQ